MYTLTSMSRAMGSQGAQRHTNWIELTAFQRDCLEAVARREHDGKTCYPYTDPVRDGYRERHRKKPHSRATRTESVL